MFPKIGEKICPTQDYGDIKKGREYRVLDLYYDSGIRGYVVCLEDVLTQEIFDVPALALVRPPLDD